MPGQTSHSAAKNTSKSIGAKETKNVSRVDDSLYGRITRVLGNKMFMVIDNGMQLHRAYIRDEMACINVSDMVLLKVRKKSHSVCDIVSIFSKKDISRLLQEGRITNWFACAKNFGAAEDESDDKDGGPQSNQK